MSPSGEYRKQIMDAAHNERIALAVARAIKSYRGNTQAALAKFPATVELAKEVTDIKARSIKQMRQLAGQAAEAIRSNHGHAYIAETADDALKIIDGLVGTGKVVVKAKSMTCDEMGVREHLEKRGNEVYETDLGEFIIQKLHSKPMHILSPAVHVPKEDVAKLLSGLTGEQLPPDNIERMVAAARKLLRQKFIEAQVGVSGANVVAAETGSLFIIENEGNARLVTGLPDMHIALIGMEKLVPALSDAFKVIEVTWRYANYTVPSYVNMISGPSKTGDIEKVTTYGAHGPAEFHVIFVDGGRSELAQDPILSQALYCLRCGGCLYECPVFAVTAGTFGDKYFTGIGAVWAAKIDHDMEKAASIAYTCLTCRRCRERCPVGIDSAAMCIELRRLAAQQK